MWVTQRHAIAFLKPVKQESNFSQTFEWQGILRRKTNKSYDKTAVRNDPENSTKKIESNNWILLWAFGNEFLRSDFLQLSFKVCENYFHPRASYSHYCVCLHKFSRVNQNVLVSYMSHKLRTKIMAQLNFVQRLQIANQKGYSNFDNSARHDFFIKTISDVFSHASYKCPVNSCFEWACTANKIQ